MNPRLTVHTGSCVSCECAGGPLVPITTQRRPEAALCVGRVPTDSERQCATTLTEHWVSADVRVKSSCLVVGTGCCGTTPDHVSPPQWGRHWLVTTLTMVPTDAMCPSAPNVLSSRETLLPFYEHSQWQGGTQSQDFPLHDLLQNFRSSTQ